MLIVSLHNKTSHMFIFKFFSIAAAVIALASPQEAASHTLGLGGNFSSRAGAASSDSDTSFAAVINPALISSQTSPLISAGLSSYSSHYYPLKQIVIDSPTYRTQTATNQVGDFLPEHTQNLLWSFGFSYPFLLPTFFNGRKMGVGVTLSGPIGSLRSFSSPTPYDFTALRYGTSDPQFKATIASSVEVIASHVSIGVGLSMYMTTAGVADAYLLDENPTGRMNLNVKLNSAAILGLFAKFNGKSVRHSTALVYRQSIRPVFEQKFNGSVQIFKGTQGINIPVILKTSLYYEPQSLEAEWQVNWKWGKGSVGFSYELWDGYEPSMLEIQTTSANQSTVMTKLPPLSIRNTLNPRVSIEIPITNNDVMAMTMGYQFRPTPIKDLSGPSNLMDTNIHIIATGIRYRFGGGELMPLSFAVSIYGQYHLFENRVVTKKDPTFIGSPGYEIRGNASIFGASLEAVF